MEYEDTAEPLYLGPEKKSKERPERKSLWEDVTNGIAIPQASVNNATYDRSTHRYTYETEITPKQERWFLKLFGIDLIAKDMAADVYYTSSDEIGKDRYQIYALLQYLSTYESESHPVELKYNGQKGQWKLGIKEMWSYLYDWSGCITTTPEGREYFDSDDYPGRPNRSSEGLIYQPDSVEARKIVKTACEQMKGEFLESLGGWIQELLISSIELRMETKSPRRMNINSLKNLKHQR
jgi:hypothetical protein